MLTRRSKIPYAAQNAVCKQMAIDPEPKIGASIGNKRWEMDLDYFQCIKTNLH